jgi:hypothetical protein
MRRLSTNTVASALLLTLAATLSAGCQAFAPGSLAALTPLGQEKKILKQAEVDPFPSPADVGLSSPTSTP